MRGDPESEWAYGCWRPGDIVLEECVSYTHARKLTEDGGVVYRGYASVWGKIAEHDALIDGHRIDIVHLDQHDMYPRILERSRRESLWH